MGSACCIAERDKTLQNGTNNDVLHRTRRRSPPWSYQWDRRGRVASDVDNALDENSHGINRSIDFDTKGGREMEFTDISDGGSPVENFPTPTPQTIPSGQILVKHNVSKPFWQVFEIDAVGKRLELNILLRGML